MKYCAAFLLIAYSGAAHAAWVYGPPTPLPSDGSSMMILGTTTGGERMSGEVFYAISHVFTNMPPGTKPFFGTVEWTIRVGDRHYTGSFANEYPLTPESPYAGSRSLIGLRLYGGTSPPLDLWYWEPLDASGAVSAVAGWGIEGVVGGRLERVITTARVPEPGTLPLLAAVLALYAGLRRPRQALRTAAHAA